MPNGNKFKGTKKKKGFRKKNPNPDFDERLDEYALVSTIQGGKHLSVKLFNTGNDIVQAIIKGSHHRKIWYKKDEIVIIRSLGNLYEVQGKVPPDEARALKRQFDKLNTNDNTNTPFVFNDEVNDSDNSEHQCKINKDDINNSDDFDFDAI
jgi:hypothetical protein